MRIAAQLDLARQKETLDFIFRHIDFLAKNGYNSLQLYLEGGVRTESFDFADPEKSYSADEMRAVVAYAAARGIEVIPALNVLGHCELFLAHPQLADLSEQRDCPPETMRQEFCPSDPRVFDFLDKYIGEIADIFPSPSIHIGCDEVFSLGSCSRCRERLASGTTRGKMFADHVNCAAQICRKYGKRPEIWDDMPDFFPEVLDLLDRDIVMVFWEYNPLIETKLVKYGSRKRIDILSEYEKRGFSFIGAPGERSYSNTVSMSNYLLPSRPAGMLLTGWEHAIDFIFSWYPLIAFAGRWWAQGGKTDPEQVFAETVSDLFGVSDPDFIAAVRLFSDGFDVLSPLGGGANWGTAGFRKMPNDATYRKYSEVAMTTAVLEKYRIRVTDETAKLVLEDMLMILLKTKFDLDCSMQINQWYRFNSSAVVSESEREFDLYRQKMYGFWKKVRPGLKSPVLDSLLKNERAALDTASRRREEAGGLLELRFLLPDIYGNERIRVDVLYTGASDFETVFNTVPKPFAAGEQPYFTFYALLKKQMVDRVRITASGGNGVGLVNCTIERGLKRILPAALGEICGEIHDPEMLLTDDTRWAFLGNHDGLTALWNREMNEKKHSLELIFNENN